MFYSFIAAGISALHATDYHLYYLGGQSNMDGYGFIKELPEDLKEETFDGVRIFHGNVAKDGVAPDGRGLWSTLKAGHGRNFKSDGETNQYSNRFGVELTFARKLKELYPNRKIAILKYSKGGTSIAPDAGAAKKAGCWDPDWEGGENEGKGINQYDHFLATLKHALADKDIDDDGEDDHLIPTGIAWMQGESDSLELEVANEYKDNLTELMNLIRKELGNQEARVVIGRITDWEVWKYSEEVRKAQADFVKADRNAALVTSTDEYGKSDKWHYDSAGYLDLGVKFAEAMAGKD